MHSGKGLVPSATVMPARPCIGHSTHVKGPCGWGMGWGEEGGTWRGVMWGQVGVKSCGGCGCRNGGGVVAMQLTVLHALIVIMSDLSMAIAPDSLPDLSEETLN